MSNKDNQDSSTKRHPQTGVVSRVSGDKSIGVTLNMLVKHPKYGKYVNRRTKLSVHDPANQAVVGDTVEIVPCRPISKRKSWRVVRVVRSTGIDA